MKLSKPHHHVLLALAAGHTLKAHRYLDGVKVYRLHPLTGPAEIVERSTVDDLIAQQLIDSNKKFPAATYWLTASGKTLAAELRAAKS